MTCISDEFIAAMRHYPASVALIATGAAPNRSGMTATAVCSLTAAPPQMLVCMNTRSGTLRALQKNGVFSINVLHSAQKALAARFSSGDPTLRGDAKFSADCWREGVKGTPVLLSASQSFVCKVVNCVEAGTHMIVVGSVLHVARETDAPALLYENGQFGAFRSEPQAQSA